MYLFTKGGYASKVLAFTFFLLITTVFSNDLKAQCASPVSVGTCSGGNGPVTNNANINSGQTYWYTGNGTFGVINLNGGTLRICGKLTLSNLNFNGGKLIIEAGGSLSLNTGGALNLNGNCTIANSGELNINKTVVMQNANNVLFNAAGAVLNMNGGDYRLDINSPTSTFINNGTANIQTLFVQSSASGMPVCLGPNSCTNLSNLNNNLTNSFKAAEGSAVLRYTGNALLNNNLTNNENIFVCRAPGATISGSASFGSARVSNNCGSCTEASAPLSPLPIELIFFNGKQDKEGIEFTWATATELNNDYFTLEKSTDGIHWNALATIPGAGISTETLRYSFVDKAPEAGIQYYRLKQTDFDGSATFSVSIVIDVETPDPSITIYPNPNQSNHLNIRGIGNDVPYVLALKNITGELLYSQTFHSNSLDLPVVEKGVYLITLRSAGNFEDKTFKYVVL